EQGRGGKRNVLRDRRHLALVDQNLFREGADAQGLMIASSPAVADRAMPVEREDLLTHDEAIAAAIVAPAAGSDKRDDHMIPSPDRLDPLAYRLNSASSLVAIIRRKVAAPGALRIGDVGVTDRAGLDVHQHLARSGTGDGDFLLRKRFAKGAADGGTDDRQGA